MKQSIDLLDSYFAPLFVNMLQTNRKPGDVVPSSIRRLANDRHELVIHGRPFLIRGGELNNSSFSSDEYMSNVWPSLVQNGLNTVLGAVAWEDIEPEEGQFVFSNFDRIVEDARRFDLKVVVLWFGAWKNGETDVW